MALASRNDLRLKWDSWPERLDQVQADRRFELVSRMDFHREFYPVLEQGGGSVWESWGCVVLSAKVGCFLYWQSHPRVSQSPKLNRVGRT